MKKIVYVISSLNRSGPVNVLYNLVSNIDENKYEITVVAIKANIKEDMTPLFMQEGVSCISLNLNFVQTLYAGRSKLKKILHRIKPDIVHAQCFRSAVLISGISGNWKTCATIHCYPHIDFVYEYGALTGRIMSWLYINALRRIDAPIACSKSISNELENKYSLHTDVVRNGVNKPSYNELDLSQYKKNDNQRIFLCVSCFNKRKNQRQLLLSARRLLELNKISIIFLGDGEYRNECEQLKIANTYFMGNVENVYDYYAAADGIISASKAEGLPMAVLEALMMGVPSYILSNIAPHREIASMFPGEVKIVNYNNLLDDEMINAVNNHTRYIVMNEAEKMLSAYKMAKEYCDVYG